MAPPARRKVRVFTTPTCSWCLRTRAFLREHRIPFREVDISRNPAAARDLVRRTGQMVVPVVEIDGRLIVGFDRRTLEKALGVGRGGR